MESGPALLLDAEAARELTAQIRSSIAAVAQAGAAMADRVRRAHAGRIWRVLGYDSWADYAAAEFGVSRAQAYRLVSMAHTAEQLASVAAALAAVSPMGGMGLSGRALRAIGDRVDDVAAAPAAMKITQRYHRLQDSAVVLTLPLPNQLL